MKYFIGFQKKKKLLVIVGNSNNTTHALALNAELMRLGYILTDDAFTAVSTNTVESIDTMYNDLIYNIKSLLPDGDSFTPLFKDFPVIHEDTVDKYKEILEAVLANNTEDMLRFEQTVDTNLDLQNLKEIGLMEQPEFKSILDNIISANSSISSFDKSIVAWYLDNGYSIDLNKVKFNETLAYLGSLSLEKGLPISTRNATNILRIWAAYSGGDVGLKENVKFKRPTSAQKALLLSTLNGCNNLEEAFKIDREKWLRLLFYLHPMTAANKAKYPEVYKWAVKLRNTPKELKTFNSKVETFISNKDEAVLDLLPKKMGVFTRRLDHMIRLFGDKAVDKWLTNGPTPKQLIDVYNHLYGREKSQARSAVLAGDSSSNVVTYGAVAPIPKAIVDSSREKILEELHNAISGTITGLTYIDPVLYARPLTTNNRASSFSLAGKAVGTIESLHPNTDVVRMYTMWSGSNDIDLSGWAIGDSFNKVGYAGSNSFGTAIVYSGDNTGIYSKNAEFIDINLKSLPSDVEWVVTEARSFTGGPFSTYKKPVYSGWMSIEAKDSKSSKNWLPQNVTNAITIQSNAREAFLCALHVPTKSIVYLDVAMAGGNVSTEEDIIKFKVYLNTLIQGQLGEISWNKINQGHILEIASIDIVADAKEAENLFTEDTPQEEVSKYI